jgi:nucleotide-binding universal stress UspA family protein
MRNILCPVDFSANSLNAVKYASELNKKLKAKLILLYAYETPVLYADPAFLPAQFDADHLHDVAKKKLKEFHKKIFGNGGKDVEMILQQGLASSRIVEIATEKRSELIVMGVTGTHAGERMLMGSNASRVIKDAPCMVLLVPHRAKLDGLKKIVYATDFSKDNLAHAKEIIPVSKKFDSEILFLHVEPTSVAYNEAAVKRVTDQIKKLIPYPKKSGYICSDDSVTDGIDYFLKHHKADCLAIFKRHRNILQEFYRPSISKKVSLHASVPLLVIHEKDFRVSE